LGGLVNSDEVRPATLWKECVLRSNRIFGRRSSLCFETFRRRPSFRGGNIHGRESFPDIYRWKKRIAGRCSTFAAGGFRGGGNICRKDCNP